MDAPERIFSLSFYPDDVISRQHCLEYLKMKAVYEFGPGAPPRSNFIELVDTALAEKLSHRAASGLVTLMMYQLAQQDSISRTKYQAGKFAEKIAKRAKLTQPRPLTFVWGDGEVRRLPFRSGANNLITSFNKYSCLGPLFAARLLSPIIGGEENTRNQALVNARRVLRIMLEIEKVVFPVFGDEFRDVWAINTKVPKDVAALRLPSIRTILRNEFPLK